MNWAKLTESIPDWEPTDAVLLTIDGALASGLARLSEAQQDQLRLMAAGFAGTPLGEMVGQNVDRLLHAEFSPAVCLALAVARASAAGALHDALAAQLGLDESVADAPMAKTEASAALRHGVQQWLVQLAVSGLGAVEETQLASFETLLQPLRDEPTLTGLAVLLSGFVEELNQAAQRQTRSEPPSRRWADLWTAAFLSAEHPFTEAPGQEMAGVFHSVGMASNEHRSFASATLWGLLVSTGNSQPQVVRLPLTSWRVSVVAGEERWKLFGPEAQPLYEALAGGQALAVKGELAANGDFLLSEAPVPAGQATPFDLPTPWRQIAPIHPLRRHPIHVSALVKVEGPVPFSNLQDLDEKQLDQATAVIGLASWDDGQWRLQPLSFLGAGKLKAGVRAGQGIAASLAKSKTDALATLQERASKLLRS